MKSGSLGHGKSILDCQVDLVQSFIIHYYLFLLIIIYCCLPLYFI